MSDRKKSTIRTIVSDRGEAISRWLMFTLNDSAYRWFFPTVYRSLSLLIVKCEPSFNNTYRWLFPPAYRSLSVSVNRALGINMFTMTGWYKKVISSAFHVLYMSIIFFKFSTEFIRCYQVNEIKIKTKIVITWYKYVKTFGFLKFQIFSS